MAVKVESQCVQLHNENCMLMRLRNSLDDTLGIPTVQGQFARLEQTLTVSGGLMGRWE